MFKNEFQGGSYFEVFSAQGKDPAAVWKLQGGSGIRKVYEKEVKSYVYSLEGTVATTKMQIPKDIKQSLSLVQRYLVIQINVPKGGEFSMEIGVSDIGNDKRRLNLSTSVKEISVTPLHAKLPLTVLKKSAWVNACLDMVNIIGETWPGKTYGKIDSLAVSANCKLRRIFTMKYQLHDTTDDNALYGSPDTTDVTYDTVPKQHQLANDLSHYNQVICMHKIRAADLRSRGDRGDRPTIDLDLSGSARRNQFAEFHIAFGTKVGKPPTAGVARKSAPTDSARLSGLSIRDSQDVQHGTTRSQGHKHAADWSEHSRHRLLSDPGTDVSTNNSRSNPLNQSRSWSGAEMHEQKKLEAVFTKPHPPPRDSSAEPVLRRHAKVRSGDKQTRTPADAHLRPLARGQSDSRAHLSVVAGHHHTISAPAHGVSKGNQQSVDNSHSKFNPSSSVSHGRGGKLAPLDRGKAPPPKTAFESQDLLATSSLAVVPKPAGNGARGQLSKAAIPTIGSSSSHRMSEDSLDRSVVDVSYGEESVTDVIRALQNKSDAALDEYKSRVSEEQVGSVDAAAEADDDDIDERELIDSLEKFVANTDNSESSGSDEDEAESPGLYLFSSPPKATAPQRVNNTNGASTNLKNVLSEQGEFVSQRPYANNSEYNPLLYSKRDEETSSHLKPPTESLQPRPPSSPKTGSRPNSGKGRLRVASRTSNSSAKPTPDSSGTGDDLKGQLANQRAATERSPVAGASEEPSGGQILISPDGDAIPSPRASAKEPRISSAGRRVRSAGSKKDDDSDTENQFPYDEQLSLPQLQLVKSSERPSPPVSRGSTRLSRKSLRELHETDPRLLKAQYSPASPTRVSHDKRHPTRADDTFDEAAMLQHLKREQELGGSITEEEPGHKQHKQYSHEAAMSDDSDHSSDESFATTSVPLIGAHDYKEEMQDTLERSDTRDNSMFSPPITLENLNHAQPQLSLFSLSDSSSGIPNQNKSSSRASEEDVLDLLFDPVLNCYFDPNTGKYYELI